MSRIKVHNADAYLDVLHNADWTPSPNCYEPTEAMKKLYEARQYSLTQPGRSEHSPGSSPSRHRAVQPITSMSRAQLERELAATERANRQRDAFIQKQRVREEEVRQRLEQNRRDVQKRAKERLLQREQEFEQRSAEFAANNTRIIEEVSETLDEEAEWAQRKRERLFAEWTAQVFQPMQDQIDSQLRVMTHEDVAQKRRYMFQCFLDEANRKRGGVFRDIIIESDYDPLTMAKESVIRYRPVGIADDPTKNRFTRECGNPTLQTLRQMSDGREGSHLSTEGPAGLLGRGAPRDASLPVTIWDHVDVTPYGHTVAPRSSGLASKFNKSSVTMDHYHVPKGTEGSKILSEELQSKGKRVFKHPETSVF